VRLFRINEPDHYYFDEVYHVVTARAYANNEAAAYDPFSPPPEEGTAYDWLHPPLAKLIQASSIKVFGDNPTAWRLPSVLFGTALIPAVFILAFLLFGPTVAIFSSLVLTFENLNLVMSRITMNDIFLSFFVVVSFIFAHLYVKNRSLRNLTLTAIFLGFSVATKWPGLYAIGVVSGLILLKDFREKKLHPRIILLIIIPIFIVPFIYL